MKKDEYLAKVKNLKNKYNEADDFAKKEYIRGLIIDLIQEISKDKTIAINGLNLVEKRLKRVNDYGKFYTYSLPHNLKEQISIVNNSINASPIHLKKVELKNTAMIQYTDKI